MLDLRRIALSAALVSTALLAPARAETVSLRYLCYADANECEVTRDLLDRFEKDNPSIKVVIDKVAFSVVRDQLETRLQAGEGPDMARVTTLASFNRYYLDLRPYVNAAYWEQNFASTLPWMRSSPSDTGIYGWMTQITATGAFVNKTLFDQAGVALPKPGASWDDWIKAAAEVQEKT